MIFDLMVVSSQWSVVGVLWFVVRVGSWVGS